MSRTGLSTVRRRRLALLIGLGALAAAWAAESRAETREVTGFAPNPGALRMFAHVPEGLPEGAPLVVALHGCTQSAEDFDDESGWVALADHAGFALLLPQQQAANNEALCFDFFAPEHNRRGRGEAASIMAMIDRMQADHGLAAERVFVTGLSAGGAMTAVLLAAYPERFAGGAVIAGVPYGCASTGGAWLLGLQKQWFLWTSPYGEAGWAAWLCGIDRTGVLRTTPYPREPDQWAALVREAEGGAPARWPRVTLWQGSADRTVHPANVGELLDQWTALHGIDRTPDAEETGPGWRRRHYRDGRGETLVEVVEVEGMGHSVPVAPGPAPPLCGRVVAPHFADHGLCAAFEIARFWGLIGAE